jgi:phytoene/squalene synthetase
MDINFFIQNCYKISELITKKYSTSFSLATSLLESEKRKAIYAIYGFVRLADEIVDSFHNCDKEYLLTDLKADLYYALENNIHTNPIIVSFADTVKKYNIKQEHIESFMKSMELHYRKV